MLFYRVAPVAQRIEQLPSKQLVVGSIPARATIFWLCTKHRLIKKIRAQRVPRPGSYPDVIQRRNAGRRLKMAAKVQAQRRYCLA